MHCFGGFVLSDLEHMTPCRSISTAETLPEGVCHVPNIAFAPACSGSHYLARSHSYFGRAWLGIFVLPICCPAEHMLDT